MALWMTTPAFLASATTIGLPIRHKRWMDWRVRIRRISSEASGTYGTAPGLASRCTDSFFPQPSGSHGPHFFHGPNAEGRACFHVLVRLLGR